LWACCRRLRAQAINGGANGGNSPAAHACQQGGYLSLVGSDGTTFSNVGDCVSYAAHGGTFATGLIIPAGQTATISASWTQGPCDALSYGYQVDFGANVPLGSKSAGCGNPSLSGGVVGPFTTAVLLRIWLNDTGTSGSCNDTFYSDGVHALVTPPNPYDVSIFDSYFCTSGPNDPRIPSGPGHGNIDVTVNIG
jgi:hypothetical protein